MSYTPYEDIDSPGELEYEEYEAAPTNPGLFGTPARIVALGVPIVVLLGLLGMVGWLLGTRSAATPINVAHTADSPKAAPKVGALAPDFSLKDAHTGQLVSLSSLRGKPVWINFWASWCEACKYEMPDMQKAYTEYKDKDLVILGIDLQEGADAVKQYTDLNGFTWTFLLDSDGEVTNRYFVSAIPTHWFVGRDGTLKAAHVGGVPQDNLKDYLARITE